MDGYLEYEAVQYRSICNVCYLLLSTLLDNQKCKFQRLVWSLHVEICTMTIALANEPPRLGNKIGSFQRGTGMKGSVPTNSGAGSFPSQCAELSRCRFFCVLVLPAIPILDRYHNILLLKLYNSAQ